MRSVNFVFIAISLGILGTPVAIHAQHDHTNMDPHQMQQVEHYTVSETFQNQLATAYEAYLRLKDAFVNTDETAAKKSAQEMRSLLEKVDMSLLDGEAHMTWMRQLMNMNEHLALVISASDIADQRAAFSHLGDSLYQSIKAFGVGKRTVYYQFCPMAMSGKGAYWLNDSQEIRNPYFGSKMLSCGNTVEEL